MSSLLKPQRILSQPRTGSPLKASMLGCPVSLSNGLLLHDAMLVHMHKTISDVVHCTVEVWPLVDGQQNQSAAS